MGAEFILDQGYRKHIIGEIESEENIKRKQESLRRYEIYNERLEEYLFNILQNDRSADTIAEMSNSVMSSINLCKRIIQEESSIYTKKPERRFGDTEESVEALIMDIYKHGRFNLKFKMANQYFNLQDQCAMQVLPKDGKLKLRVLQPHHYDVVPSRMDAEKAEVFILSQFDKNRLFDRTDNQNDFTPQPSGVEYRINDRMNNKIADQSDWEADRGLYVFWTDQFHFTTNANGQIINPETMMPFEGEVPPEMLVNPIGKLPFVDVKEDTDGEYWQRTGNSTVDFTVQFALMLSDVNFINKYQGFAQPIVSAMEPPKNLIIGPNQLLFLKKSKNADPAAQPEFSFASPNPDMMGSIELMKSIVSLFLSSKGQDAGTITADGASAQRYASAIDRLLANIEKFEASEDDFDLFRSVEMQVFELIKLWQDAFSGVTEGGLELSGIIPEDTKLDVQFAKPSSEISAEDKLRIIERKLEMGLMSRVEAIAMDREMDLETARETMEEIDADRTDLMPIMDMLNVENTDETDRE
jgi:hypothetical protein